MDIARRFGVTVRFVEGRLRLADLAPVVFEALGTGAIHRGQWARRSARLDPIQHPSGRGGSLEREIGDTPAATGRLPNSPPFPTRAEDRSHFMPTSIEKSYLHQGYVLPGGLTWEMAAERRPTLGDCPIFVPVSMAPGCIGWGVPFIDGLPLCHPRS